MTDVTAGSRTETATLAGGCFWCLEAIYLDVQGVQAVKSGYAGGHVENPTYRQVCGKGTGHAEVVRVTFDPDVIGFRDLLRIFFTIHDPTTKDRQGNDVGPQYRSAVFFESDEQERATREVIREVEETEVYSDPIVTEVEPLTKFWPAEDEHDDYFRRNPNQPYCAVVVGPKVAKFRKAFQDRLVSAEG